MATPGAGAHPLAIQEPNLYLESTKAHRRAYSWGQNDTDDGGEGDWEAQSTPDEEQPGEEEAEQQQREEQDDSNDRDPQQEQNEGVVWSSPTDDESLSGGAILAASWYAQHRR